MSAHEKGIAAACNVTALSDGIGCSWGDVEAAIAAYLQASGLVLLPREPTAEILELMDMSYRTVAETRENWSEILNSFPKPTKHHKARG